MAKPPSVVRSKRRKSNLTLANVARRWWLAEDKDLWSSVRATVDRLKPQHDTWLAELREYEALYSDSTWLETDVDGRRSDRVRVSFNIARSCVDTLAARVSKGKPRPMYVTDDAEWSLARKAKKRTDYVTGIYQRSGAYDVWPETFVDACIGGTGTSKWLIEDDAIICERVLPEELIVDETEARYGKPRSIYHRRLVSRDVLASQYPDFEVQIESAPDAEPREGDSWASDADVVEAIEAWHLPSATGAGDGRWCLTIDGQTLFAAPWERGYMPFIHNRWKPPRRGFRGEGLVKELAGIQYAINRLMRDIELGNHRVARGRIVVAKGSINKAQLTREVGGIIDWDPEKGPQPTALVWSAFGPETYNYLADLYRKAYELSGISQLSANGKKPAGVDAAVALRELQDAESERFSLQAIRYDAQCTESAPMVLDLTQDLVGEGKAPTVRSKAGRVTRSLKAQDVLGDDGGFDVSVYPANILPRTPWGRQQMIAEWQKQGWVSPDEAMQLMDMPDVDKFVSLRIAALELAQMVVEKILDEEIAMEPEPYWDLATTKRIAQQELLRAQIKNAPETAQEALRQFLDKVDDAIDRAATENAPPPPPDAGMPPGDPMAAMGGGMPPEMGAPPPMAA